MTSANVSVIVPTFNRAGYLKECLDSLLKQTVPPHEILVVDDGSRDATAQVVAHYGKRVSYIFKENGGKSHAVNLGLSKCTGSIIWLFDDDDVAIHDAIEQRLAALMTSPKTGWVYSPHYIGSNDFSGSIVPGRLQTPAQFGPAELSLEIMRCCFFHLNSTLVRRETYDVVGGLDPSLLTCEDYDMQIRLARSSAAAFCPSPSFIFRQHEGVRGAASIRHNASDRMKVFRRYSQILGQKIRQQVALAEFFIPPSAGPILAEQMRPALLNRAHVMANHGCLDEMFEDLSQWVRTISGAQPIFAAEKRQLGAIIRAGFAYEAGAEDWPKFIEQMRKLSSFPNGQQAVRGMAGGLLKLAISYPGSYMQRAVQARHALRLTFESLR